MCTFTETVQAVQHELKQTDYLVNCCVEPECVPTTAIASVSTTLPGSLLERQVKIEPTPPATNMAIFPL